MLSYAGARNQVCPDLASGARRSIDEQDFAGSYKTNGSRCAAGATRTLGVRSMSRPHGRFLSLPRRGALLPCVLLLLAGPAAAAEPPPAVLDSQSIVRGLGGGGVSTRGLEVAAK